MNRAWLLAAVFAVLLLPSAEAFFGKRPPSPLPGDNGMNTAFGAINATVKAPYRGEPVAIRSTVVLADDPNLRRTAIYMFALTVPTDSAGVRFDAFTDAEGRPVTVDKDERFDGQRDQKVFVSAANVTPGRPYHLAGHAWLHENGRTPVGSIVIAFDRDWQKVVASDGQIAQIYAYTFVGTQDFPTGLAAPFQGQGRLVPGALLATVALVGGLLYVGAIYRLSWSGLSW